MPRCGLCHTDPVRAQEANVQPYLAIGILPSVVNAALIGLLTACITSRFESKPATGASMQLIAVSTTCASYGAAELHRVEEVEEVLDARLKHLETR